MTGLPEGVGQGPGLAEERTQLAWGRNGLALMVCGAALLRRIAPLAASGRQRPLAGVVVLTLGLAVWLMGAVYRRRSGSGNLADGASLRLVAYTTAAVGGVAMIISLIPG